MFSASLAVIIPIIILSSSTSPSLSDPRASQVALICSNRTALPANRQAFIANFLAAMDAVTPQISTAQYARVVEGGSSDDSVYASGECMRDLSKTDCDLCIAAGKTQLLGCLPFQNGTRGGRNYLDGCYLRYDDYKFFGEALSSDDKVVCSREDFNGNRTAFLANIAELVKRLSIEAPKSDDFLEASIEKGNTTVYGLAQCWESVNRSSCSMCLMDASMTISSCTYKQEGRVLNSGCYMRYSINHFYNNSTINDGGGKGGPNVAVILAVVFSCVAVVMITMLILFFVRRELVKRRKVSKRLGTLALTLNKSTLNFKYETLEKATNYFDSSNKLGQGGSGTVFKGVLPDGRVVAVKRLFFNTSQWVDQFFNEVNLIRGIDHKNLVKLLGCSITGPESLLVYEYVPNNSLHHYLSDHCTARMLSWEMRYNIIMGVAEGLAYLHEESQPRIIHRDIKLSNILLDENYTAKIADFGLVRLFPEDKSHISTGVAGTLGYMAPEYFVRGKLTEKADVFSFGVLMIEVVTGRRGNSQTLDPLSAVQMVWKLFKSGKSVEAIDPFLEGQFSIEKASRVLHVGLLCAQSSPELRPMMSSVVKMLSDDDEGVIPEPTQPPFLDSSTDIMSPENSGSQKGSCSYHSGSSATR